MSPIVNKIKSLITIIFFIYNLKQQQVSEVYDVSFKDKASDEKSDLLTNSVWVSFDKLI